jgi:hypothetical protein
MRFLEPPTTVAGTDEQRGRQDGAQLCALIVVKLQEGDALPSSTDEVCDMIITFVQVHFDRGTSHQQPVGTTPLQPRPPSASHKQAGGGGGAGAADRTADEPAGGACCHVM